ncbi:MAG TPA: hypothetical protein VGV38_09470 [Pyrinomonadaceae bacterium]|nr:hypothetical protein [Pyrinomonadaceae bacterium]
MNRDDAALRAVAELLARHGDAALGGETPDTAARRWLDAGIDDPEEVEEWLAARCFDAEAAAAVERAGITPQQAATRTTAGSPAYEDTIAYKLSRGHLTFEEARRIVTSDFWNS